MKNSLFALLATLGLSLSAPLVAHEDAEHKEGTEQPAKEEGKGKKEKKGKHQGHAHGEKGEKNANSENK